MSSKYSRQSPDDVSDAFQMLSNRLTASLATHGDDPEGFEALDTLQTHIAALTAEADAKQPKMTVPDYTCGLSAKKYELLKTVRAVYPAIADRRVRRTTTLDDHANVLTAIDIAQAIHAEIDNLKDEEL